MIPRIFVLVVLCASLCGLAVSGEGTPPWGGIPPAGSAHAATPDSSHVKPVPADTSRLNLKRADTVLVVRHSHQHREQIVAGGVIMACLVGILVVMNNYNPR